MQNYNFGCSAWYACEHVSENRVLRRILEPKMEVTEDWRKLHKFHDLHSSPYTVLGSSIKED